jgi:uncharacterized damage-inducible protein DinB
MRVPSPRRLSLALLALALASVSPSRARGQDAAAGAAPKATGLAAELLTDVAQVETKMLALARAIPADRYDWRPAEGVRSVSEVVRHVAADNYLLPAVLGHAVDPGTGIKGDDYTTAQAFEQRTMNRDEAIAQMERSFAYLKRALAGTTPARMGESVSLFGQPATVQGTWILTTTHLHEHLGQLIAYARSVGVVPPWSR